MERALDIASESDIAVLLAYLEPVLAVTDILSDIVARFACDLLFESDAEIESESDSESFALLSAEPAIVTESVICLAVPLSIESLMANESDIDSLAVEDFPSESDVTSESDRERLIPRAIESDVEKES